MKAPSSASLQVTLDTDPEAFKRAIESGGTRLDSFKNKVDRPRSDAHAAEKLGDTPYLAHALVQAFKLFIALVCKRWPELR